MLDDLDLAWEEQQEPRRRRGAPPSRQIRQRRRKERKRRRRSFGALFISFLLLAGLGVGVYWGVGKAQEFFGAADYPGNPQAVAVDVTVNQGDTATEIGTELFEKKVVKSVNAFVRAADAEPRSKNIQPGTYRLYEQTKASVALAMLLDPEKNLAGDLVTIPEGKTAIDTYTILSKATGIPAKDFQQAAAAAMAKIPDYWFKLSDDNPRDIIKSIEGFLFPDTYRFAPDATAQQILETMIDQFLTVVGDIKFTETVESKLHITPFEALVVASLAQVEAGKEADMGKVARVAYNRVFKDFACGCLQFDVVVNYWLQKNGKPTKASKDMLRSELDDTKNPYNTHVLKGLPPGPISNPGKVALEGAMDPPTGNWLYFVAVDDKGTTKFASTHAEFTELNLEACKNGIVACP